jgi:hypothetical protein
MSQKSASTMTLSRTVQVDERVDLVVCGGGPAGCASALSAARLGKRVVLLEATGALGGMGTQGLVSNWYSLSDGERIIVKGLFWEILSRLQEMGGLPPDKDIHDPGFQQRLYAGTGFDPETLKRLLDRICKEGGVEVRFETRLIDVERKGTRVQGLFTHSVEGYLYLPCSAVIDATGNAVLADLCGVPCRRAGRDTEKIMPPTLCGVVTGIDFNRFHRGSMQEKVEEAIGDNFFSQPDRHIPGLFRSGQNHATQNCGHLFGTDALSTASLSAGYAWGRELAEEYTEFARRYLPGCESAHLLITAQLLGIRESRCIIGEYELSYEDFRNRRNFSDEIGIYNKAIDIHVYDLSDEEYQRYLSEFEQTDKLGKGESYGLPYRILLPQNIDNLWVPGRCASSDIKVNGAIRDQPACYLMGEAAGTAASLALDGRVANRDIDVDLLRNTLRSQGAWLPER